MENVPPGLSLALPNAATKSTRGAAIVDILTCLNDEGARPSCWNISPPFRYIHSFLVPYEP